jgi:hypothetical protein
MKPIKNGKKTDRDAKGKFAAGNKAGGRTPGSRNKTTLAAEALLEGQAECLTMKVIEMAMEGDATAVKLCVERIWPPPRKDRPVHFDLPEITCGIDPIQAITDILNQVSDGKLTPMEAGSVIALLHASSETRNVVGVLNQDPFYNSLRLIP